MTDKKTADTNDKKSAVEVTSEPSASITLSSDASKTKSETLAKGSEKKTRSSDGAKITPKNTSAQSIKKENMQSSSPTPLKISKTALLAFLIALIALGAVGGLYFWQNQQQALLTQDLLSQLKQQTTDNKKQAITNKQQVALLLAEQQSNLTLQLEKTLSSNQLESQSKITALENTVSRLSQNQPSDWLIHEVEYLIRIAARTIWLEQDTRTAINLLKDADQRISELNAPEFLPVRQLIHQDIEALQLMPVLNTEEVILTLMAMEKQIGSLSLAMVKIPASSETTESFELTENTSDWRSNLAKTWRKFLADFITINRRTANVEPLMSPQYQQHLRENLALKIQLALWAASKQNSQLFSTAIGDIQLWLKEYFDMDNLSNQRFNAGLQSLSKEVIGFNYNNKLSSLDAIRTLLNETPSNKVPLQIKDALKQPKQIERDNSSEITEPTVVNENELSEDT
ncbi:MAG: uroporphyrin-3 C-methyltransferase [Alteromonadaceae bacterium]|jgi:uroporphyrin-3 C-methyltransferase